MHTARVPAPHNHSQHNQCRTPYAAAHTLVLLMMGIMLPETCWDRSLIINIRLVASCWFLSFHLKFLATFVHLFSCNNNITLKMAAIAAETCWWGFSEWNTPQILKCILWAIYILWMWLMHERWNVLTLILLTWKIWWASNNASRWQMEFNSTFKGLK